MNADFRMGEGLLIGQDGENGSDNATGSWWESLMDTTESVVEDITGAVRADDDVNVDPGTNLPPLQQPTTDNGDDNGGFDATTIAMVAIPAALIAVALIARPRR